MSRQPDQSIALKEWAVAIQALSQGDQILLLRKGGIAEEAKEFQLKENCFYLFPTYLHQKAELLKEEFQPILENIVQQWDQTSKEIPIQYFAEVVQDIEIQDDATLARLYPFHIWTENFAEARLHWKREKPLHLLIVKVYRLEQTTKILLRDKYNGCKSWISLKDEIPQMKITPVLSEEDFEQRVQLILQSINS
ncbi:DUF1802 family protein [Tepidibacillus infernus]|uniref:DUF1802 family protein n=1 Tax=Tepidibacillus infernus TaxID=1806172 RepID=UPI003B7086B6